MGPPSGGEREEAEEDEDVEEVEREDGVGELQGGEATEEVPSFAELLGPHCVIKRVDKDKNVLGPAKPEEMQQELMTKAGAQKRLGACAEHVKDMSWREKLQWALDLKDRANELYVASHFEEAARLYNDCLVALDLDGAPAQRQEVQTKLQLPVCTNLAACMIEMGAYARCVEICEIALGVDPHCVKALYRRGLARYRVGNHNAARNDLEAALAALPAARAAAAARRRQGGDAESKDAGGATADEEAKSLDDVERRVMVYLGHIRRYSQQERDRCRKMFEDKAQGTLYAEKPVAKGEEDEPLVIDDSDEAIERALSKARGSWDWSCCSCRRRAEAKDKTA